MTHRLLTLIAAAIAALTLAAAPAEARSKGEKAQRLVVNAADTVSYFAQDSAYEPLWDLADNAKAMVVIPRSLRGGFMFGASGGNAVMVARNENGGWSEPTFFTIGSVSFGFQIGGEASETILLVMTQRGVEQLLSTSVKLGGDLSLAAGPVGGGAKAQTADILAFSRSRGLYGGVSLEGAVLKTRHGWNSGYYGEEVSPVDVIYREKVAQPQSAVLQNAVWALANRSAAPVQPLPSQNAPGQEGPANIAPVRPVAVDPVTGEPLPAEPVYEDDAIYGEPL